MKHLERLTGIVPMNILHQVDAVKEITSELRLAHFLSQCAHESGDFIFTNENCNYSCSALQKVFPKHFSSVTAEKYARDPKAIANRAYAGRMGNGNELSGDGYKYRGRGYIQITGRDNYEGFGEFIGEDCIKRPDLISLTYPLQSAAWFFTSNNIWQLCDHGSCSLDVTAVTKRINGGTNGLADRLKRFNTIYKALSA